MTQLSFYDPPSPSQAAAILSQSRISKDRALKHAKAREMRKAYGLPPCEALNG